MLIRPDIRDALAVCCAQLICSKELVNVTGHWRSPDSGWQEELNQSEIKPNRGDISSIEWLVMAPGLESPSGEWEPIKQGQADFLNGGGE